VDPLPEMKKTRLVLSFTEIRRTRKIFSSSLCNTKSQNQKVEAVYSQAFVVPETSTLVHSVSELDKFPVGLEVITWRLYLRDGGFTRVFGILRNACQRLNGGRSGSSCCAIEASDFFGPADLQPSALLKV
jgi:hypothetical protein